jgi:hypothetical protein
MTKSTSQSKHDNAQIYYDLLDEIETAVKRAFRRGASTEGVQTTLRHAAEGKNLWEILKKIH